MNKRVAIASGVAGLALIGLGAWAYSRERRLLAGTPQRMLGRGRMAQAPIVSSYNDGQMKTTLRSAPNMPIEQRLATIQDLVHKSVQDPQMRKISLQATAHCPERDGLCEAKAIYDFIKARVRYTGDIAPIRHPDGTVDGIDLYQSARRTLEFGGGDCDDHNILAATMLAQNGITPKMRVVKTRGAPDWEHIYTIALLPKGTGNKTVALDTTLPGSTSFGIEPSYHKHIDFDA